MIWPPQKAWTSKSAIEGSIFFVAINYGGNLLNRWVILMSVLDSNVVIKLSWAHLVDEANWKCGWDDDYYSNSSELVFDKTPTRADICSSPSFDSGLTVPITENNIRPWFRDV